MPAKTASETGAVMIPSQEKSPYFFVLDPTRKDPRPQGSFQADQLLKTGPSSNTIRDFGSTYEHRPSRPQRR